MSRIESCINQLQSNNQKAVIPYIVAGDPCQDATVDVMHKLVELGADILEIGVPFSDPMAEGPVIQKAHERALVHNTGLVDVLAMVKTFREIDTRTPIVLMGYANPIEAMGYEKFAESALSAGVDGVLTVDIPPEEASDLKSILGQRNIDCIFLISPTTSADRIAKICEQATGYLYYVSLKGVTGAGHLDGDEVKKKIESIKTHTNLPICVGFGIKDESSARMVAACADGVIVGSALVDKFSHYPKNLDGSDKSALLAELGEKFSSIVSGVKN